MNDIRFPTDLETVARLQFNECADDKLRAVSPNGAFLIEIEGDELRFIPYGGSPDETEKFRLVRV